MKRFLLIGAALLALSACDSGNYLPPPPAKQAAAARGADMAEAAMAGSTDNAEQSNIQRRIKLTNNPGQVGFILLLNQAGQPIVYTSVKGKITSSGKRLTSPQQKININCGQYCDQTLAEAPSDEGTYGHSDDYIYFWTEDGQYMQWKGDYLYSDKPFRTNIQPLVIKTVSDSPAPTKP